MSYFYQLFQHFVTWLLNPGAIIDNAGAMLFNLHENVWFQWIAPQTLQDYDNKAVAFFHTGYFTKIVGLFMYFSAPFVDPQVLGPCLDVMLSVWLFTAIFSLGFMIKGWISGTGA